MKKTLILSILLFSIFSLTAQTLIQDSIDIFTGKCYKQTSLNTLFVSDSLILTYRLINVENDIEIQLILSGKFSPILSIARNQKILLKLSNNKIIKSFDKIYSMTYLYENVYHIEAYYDLSKNQIRLLKNNLINNLRIYTSNIDFEIEILNKDAEKFKQSIILIN